MSIPWCFHSDWLARGSDLQEDREAGVSERAAAGRLLQQLRQHGLQWRPDGLRIQVHPRQRRDRHRGLIPVWSWGKWKAVWLIHLYNTASSVTAADGNECIKTTAICIIDIQQRHLVDRSNGGKRRTVIARPVHWQVHLSKDFTMNTLETFSSITWVSGMLLTLKLWNNTTVR